MDSETNRFHEYEAEIDMLRARVVELEKENAQMREYGSPRCVFEAEKRVQGLEEQLAAVTKERDEEKQNFKDCHADYQDCAKWLSKVTKERDELAQFLKDAYPYEIHLADGCDCPWCAALAKLGADKTGEK